MPEYFTTEDFTTPIECLLNNTEKLGILIRSGSRQSERNKQNAKRNQKT
jgi:hypothetical protein